MDNVTMNSIGEVLNSFGAWGFAGVLLWMQITVMKSLTEALNRFTVALNVITDGKAGV
jgi:hypothetical protein